MSLRLQAISQILTTDVNGSAFFNIKVPGIFGGIPDGLIEPASGRNIVKAEIWTVKGTDGDRLTSIRVTDSDGLLDILKSKLPNYPDIQYFVDSNADPVLQGLYIPTTIPLILHPLVEGYSFIPSGLYLAGTFQTANPQLLGQQVIINIHWASPGV